MQVLHVSVSYTKAHCRFGNRLVEQTRTDISFTLGIEQSRKTHRDADYTSIRYCTCFKLDSYVQQTALVCWTSERNLRVVLLIAHVLYRFTNAYSHGVFFKAERVL